MPSLDRYRSPRLPTCWFFAVCCFAGVTFAGQGPSPTVEPWELCRTPEAAIPDFDLEGVFDTSPEIVDGCVAITDINLYVEITHPWVGDLLIKLVSTANGTASPYEMTVLDRPGYPALPFGCDGDDLPRNTFDDEGTFNAETDCNANAAYPIGKHLIPSFAMKDWLGDDTCGLWQIQVYDLSSGQTGTLHRWCVRVNHVFHDDFEGGDFVAWSGANFEGD